MIPQDADRNDDMVVSYYRLEIVAERVGLSRSRIRAFERAGLVGPARVQGRVRLYGETELARLRRLRRLFLDLGLNAAGVEIVARLLDDVEALRAELRAIQAGK